MGAVTHHQGPVSSGVGAPDLVAGDFALSGGFGSTGAIAVASGSKDTRGKATITANGTGLAANPTCTLTFKEAFDVAPIAVVSRGNEAGDDQLTVPFTVRTTATQMILTFLGTPVAADTYTVYWCLEAAS